MTARQRLPWLWTRESLLRLILSLVLAVALWLYISNKQNPSIAQDYGQPLPIAVANLPIGMAVVNDNLGVVFVRIKRTDSNTPVTPSSFHSFVDLLGLGPGQHRVSVQVLADPGIQIVERKPARVLVVLERTLSRRVQVHANVLSHTPTGYGWSARADPSTVTVSGPEQLVSQVERTTFDLDLSGLKTSLSGSYRVRPENSRGGLVTGPLTLAPSQIHVTISVQALSSYKTLPVLVPLAGQPKTGYGAVSVNVSPAEITASGSPERLSSISTVKTAPVSIARRGAGAFTTRVRLQMPKGLTSRNAWVSVRTQLAPVAVSNSIEIGIAPIGVTPGLTAHTQPARILATIVGLSTDLKRAGAQVSAVLDLTGYGPGTYTLTPVVRAPKGVHVESTYPPSVTVTLSSSSG